MERTRTIGTVGFKGYRADDRNVKPEYLAGNSANCLIDTDGVAHARPGYEATGLDLGQAGKPARPFYQKQYDLTWYAVGTKVYYTEGTSTTKIDTGITLTDGTTTRFAEYAGDLYLTNQTDGMRRIVVGRLRGAASSGATSLAVDNDFAARLSAFTLGSGTVLINGTSETYSTVTTSSTSTLTVTALSQSYADNAIIIRVHDISSGREKFSKVVFWKERMTGIGATDPANADQPLANVFFSKFAVATTLENIIDFAGGGASGSTTELVGKSGKITNILPTNDYLYVFKEEETFVISAADVNASTGASLPNLRSPDYGCVNEDCAAEIGNGEIAFLTGNKRVMRIKSSTDSGAPIVFPDESFDVPIQRLLRQMDEDQAGAHLFYHKGKRRLYVHLKIQSQWYRLVYDNNLRAWQPPQTGLSFTGYFERDGIAYATDRTDDAVYQCDSSYNDNGSPIEVYISSGKFPINGLCDRLDVIGRITQPTTAYFKNPVDPESSGIGTVEGAGYSYGGGSSVGSFSVGSQPLGGDDSETEDTARYDKSFGVFPSEGSEVSFQAFCFGDAHWFSVEEYAITYREFPSFNSLQ